MISISNGRDTGEIVVKIIGVGGAGNNAINRLENDGTSGVELIGMNTAVKDLGSVHGKRVQIGERLTKGLGAGARPEIGEKAAEESREAIAEALKGADMAIITCGMGGGTGTGAAPVVARISHEMGILTVGVVTRPFGFEGGVRMSNAKRGLENIKKYADTLIVIPNDKLLLVVDKKTTMTQAFEKGDEVLRQTIQGITDIMNINSDINVDFADIKTVMTNKGVAHIGIGDAKGEQRAMEAIRIAIESPLLEHDIKGATDLIFSISGDFSLMDVNDAVSYVGEKTGGDANIILGARYDRSMQNECSITVIATGIEDQRNDTFESIFRGNNMSVFDKILDKKILNVN